MKPHAVGAVILATRDTGFGDAARPEAVPSSLVSVAGEPLVQRVIRAVQETPDVAKTVVIAAAEGELGGDEQFASTGSLGEDILAGLVALGDCAHAVLLPGDIAFVTSAEIGAFVATALARDVQMAYPMVQRSVCEAAFPDLRRSYFRLAEGELTGASALYLDVPTFLGNPEIISQAVELRREPWRLALMVDPTVLFAYGAGRLSTTYIEAAAEKALGVRTAVTILEAPGLATDIQKPVDLRAARIRLGETGPSPAAS